VSQPLVSVKNNDLGNF